MPKLSNICIYNEALVSHGKFKNQTHEVTYPGSNLTLPKPALLSDFVGASKLLHVLAEVTLGTVLCPSAGFTLPTHSH